VGRQLSNEVIALSTAGSLPGLSTNARLVLYAMAHYAHDNGRPPETPARCYFGGWELLAGYMGCDKYNRSAHERIRRAVAELVEAGYIVPRGRRGGRHGPRIYFINVGL
jgi:hypothetical protein